MREQDQNPVLTSVRVVTGGPANPGMSFSFHLEHVCSFQGERFMAEAFLGHGMATQEFMDTLFHLELRWHGVIKGMCIGTDEITKTLIFWSQLVVRYRASKSSGIMTRGMAKMKIVKSYMQCRRCHFLLNMGW